MKHPDEDNPAAPPQRPAAAGPLRASTISHTGLRRRANEESFVDDAALGHVGRDNITAILICSPA